MLRSLTPGVDIDVHAPPDAVVLHRRDPTRVLNPARWVELEAEHRGREVLDAVGELDGAPGGDERRASADFHAVGPGCERRAQGATLEPSREIESRVVDKVGFVDDRDDAILQLEGERSLHRVEVAHRRRGEQVLVAIGTRYVGVNPPGAGIVGDGEFGELVRHLEIAKAGIAHLVAEADAVVEGADSNGELPVRRGGLDELDAQLVVVLAHA